MLENLPARRIPWITSSLHRSNVNLVLVGAKFVADSLHRSRMHGGSCCGQDALCRLRIRRSALDSYARRQRTSRALSVMIVTHIAKIHSKESPSPTNGARAPSRTNESGTENKTMSGRQNTPQPKKPSPRINLGRRRQNHSSGLSSDRFTSASLRLKDLINRSVAISRYVQDSLSS